MMHFVDGSNRMVTNVINVDSDEEDLSLRTNSGPPTPYSVGLEGDPEFNLSDNDVVSSQLSTAPRVQWHNPIVKIKRLESPPAWLRSSEVRTASLGVEIAHFLDYSTPYAYETHLRTSLVQKIIDLTQSLWPDATLQVFGSFETTLHLPLSDLDMVVFNSCGGKTALFKLAKALRKEGYNNIQVISRARVPIIKFSDPKSATDVDICFDQTSGVHSSAFVKTALQQWPPLKPLVLVLKYFLRLRGLNEPFSGGMGSYALVLMVLSFLQMSEFYTRPGPNEEDQCDLGFLLFEFFHFYGCKFNYVTTGLGVRSGGCYFPKAWRGWLDSECPTRLCVEDPQNPENDVGKSAYKTHLVQQHFASAHELIVSAKSNAKRTLLQQIFGDGHELIEQHRMKHAKYRDMKAAHQEHDQRHRHNHIHVEHYADNADSCDPHSRSRHVEDAGNGTRTRPVKRGQVEEGNSRRESKKYKSHK